VVIVASDHGEMLGDHADWGKTMPWQGSASVPLIVSAPALGVKAATVVQGTPFATMDIAGIKLERKYDLSAPKGVNGRNSDNTRIQALMGWQPGISLRRGLEQTYAWIEAEYLARQAAPAGSAKKRHA
jgi:hypothetical protein